MNPENITSDSTPSSPHAEVKLKLPFKELVIHPSNNLRMRILELSHKTGKTAKKILEMLLMQAVGIPVEWIIIQQLNGAEAGVSLNRVEDALKRTFLLLRDVKGVIKTVGNAVPKATIDKLMTEVITLSTHAQGLAKNTFYNNVELVAGRKVYWLFSDLINGATKKLEEESAKGALGDQAIINERISQIADFTVILSVLTRLAGCRT